MVSDLSGEDGPDTSALKFFWQKYSLPSPVFNILHLEKVKESPNLS